MNYGSMVAHHMSALSMFVQSVLLQGLSSKDELPLWPCNESDTSEMQKQKAAKGVEGTVSLRTAKR